MYEQHWQLHRLPFENSIDTDFFFASQTHQAALLKLQYVIENRHGAGLLVGDTGAGKSFLIAQLQSVLPDHCGPLVQIVYPQLQPAELLAYIASELSTDGADLDPRHTSLDRILRSLADRLRDWGRQQRHPILVVDEAHLIDQPGVFQALQLLLNFREQPDINFTLFLVGNHSLLPQIQRVGQFCDRIAVKGVLQPLSAAETAQYVQHRLQTAGRQEPIFDSGALNRIFEFSQGLPRRINRLCDLALLVGLADEQTRIGAAEIEAVAEEVFSVVPD